MSSKGARIIVLLGVAAVITLLVARHVQPPAIVGRWSDESPAALLYEFREDGSVWLIRDGQDLPVWRYDVTEDVVEFHDGMGRPRVYRFAIAGDRLTLRALETGAVEQYRREP